MGISDPDFFIGLWQLASVSLDDGSLPFGKRPEGSICYQTGCMSVHIRGSGVAAERRRIYAGTWSYAEGVIEHQVVHSLEPELVGAVLQRRVERDGDRLVYRTCERQGAGHPQVIWERIG